MQISKLLPSVIHFVWVLGTGNILSEVKYLLYRLLMSQKQPRGNLNIKFFKYIKIYTPIFYIFEMLYIWEKNKNLN